MNKKLYSVLNGNCIENKYKLEKRRFILNYSWFNTINQTKK